MFVTLREKQFVYILVNWTYNGSLYNALMLVVRFELYIYICVFWSNLNFKFDFFAEKYTVGAVLDWPTLQTGIIGATGTTAAPTNRFVEAAEKYIFPPKKI